METNANVVAKARKFALLATFGSFVVSAPLLPPPLSLFWECSSFGMRELVLVTLAVVVGIMLLARLTCGVRGSRAWFGVICGYVVFAFVRCLGMLGIVDACFVVLQSALFVPAFSMFIKEISELRFGEALGIVSGSIALAFLLVLPCSLAPSSTIPGLRAAFASVGCAYLLLSRVLRARMPSAMCVIPRGELRASHPNGCHWGVLKPFRWLPSTARGCFCLPCQWSRARLRTLRGAFRKNIGFSNCSRCRLGRYSLSACCLLSAAAWNCLW